MNKSKLGKLITSILLISLFFASTNFAQFQTLNQDVDQENYKTYDYGYNIVLMAKKFVDNGDKIEMTIESQYLIPNILEWENPEGNIGASLSNFCICIPTSATESTTTDVLYSCNSDTNMNKIIPKKGAYWAYSENLSEIIDIVGNASNSGTENEKYNFDLIQNKALNTSLLSKYNQYSTESKAYISNGQFDNAIYSVEVSNDKRFGGLTKGNIKVWNENGTSKLDTSKEGVYISDVVKWKNYYEDQGYDIEAYFYSFVGIYKNKDTIAKSTDDETSKALSSSTVFDGSAIINGEPLSSANIETNVYGSYNGTFNNGTFSRNGSESDFGGFMSDPVKLDYASKYRRFPTYYGNLMVSKLEELNTGLSASNLSNLKTVIKILSKSDYDYESTDDSNLNSALSSLFTSTELNSYGIKNISLSNADKRYSYSCNVAEKVIKAIESKYGDVTDDTSLCEGMIEVLENSAVKNLINDTSIYQKPSGGIYNNEATVVNYDSIVSVILGISDYKNCVAGSGFGIPNVERYKGDNQNVKDFLTFFTEHFNTCKSSASDGEYLAHCEYKSVLKLLKLKLDGNSISIYDGSGKVSETTLNNLDSTYYSGEHEKTTTSLSSYCTQALKYKKVQQAFNDMLTLSNYAESLKNPTLTAVEEKGEYYCKYSVYQQFGKEIINFLDSNLSFESLISGGISTADLSKIDSLFSNSTITSDGAKVTLTQSEISNIRSAIKNCYTNFIECGDFKGGYLSTEELERGFKCVRNLVKLNVNSNDRNYNETLKRYESSIHTYKSGKDNCYVSAVSDSYRKGQTPRTYLQLRPSKGAVEREYTGRVADKVNGYYWEWGYYKIGDVSHSAGLKSAAKDADTYAILVNSNASEVLANILMTTDEIPTWFKASRWQYLEIKQESKPNLRVDTVGQGTDKITCIVPTDTGTVGQIVERKLKGGIEFFNVEDTEKNNLVPTNTSISTKFEIGETYTFKVPLFFESYGITLEELQASNYTYDYTIELIPYDSSNNIMAEAKKVLKGSDVFTQDILDSGVINKSIDLSFSTSGANALWTDEATLNKISKIKLRVIVNSKAFSEVNSNFSEVNYVKEGIYVDDVGILWLENNKSDLYWPDDFFNATGYINKGETISSKVIAGLKELGFTEDTNIGVKITYWYDDNEGSAVTVSAPFNNVTMKDIGKYEINGGSELSITTNSTNDYKILHIKFVIDPNNLIPESNESNNIAEVALQFYSDDVFEPNAPVKNETVTVPADEFIYKAVRTQILNVNTNSDGSFKTPGGKVEYSGDSVEDDIMYIDTEFAGLEPGTISGDNISPNSRYEELTKYGGLNEHKENNNYSSTYWIKRIYDSADGKKVAGSIYGGNAKTYYHSSGSSQLTTLNKGVTCSDDVTLKESYATYYSAMWELRNHTGCDRCRPAAANVWNAYQDNKDTLDGLLEAYRLKHPGVSEDSLWLTINVDSYRGEKVPNAEIVSELDITADQDFYNLSQLTTKIPEGISSEEELYLSQNVNYRQYYYSSRFGELTQGNSGCDNWKCKGHILGYSCAAQVGYCSHHYDSCYNSEGKLDCDHPGSCNNHCAHKICGIVDHTHSSIRDMQLAEKFISEGKMEANEYTGTQYLDTQDDPLPITSDHARTSHYKTNTCCTEYNDGHTAHNYKYDVYVTLPCEYSLGGYTNTNHTDCKYSYCLGHTVTSKEYLYAVAGEKGNGDTNEIAKNIEDGTSNAIKVSDIIRDGKHTINISTTVSNGVVRPEYDKYTFNVKTPAWQTYEASTGTYADIETPLSINTTTLTDVVDDTVYDDVVYSGKEYILTIKTSKYVETLNITFEEDITEPGRSINGDGGKSDTFTIGSEDLYVSKYGYNNEEDKFSRYGGSNTDKNKASISNSKGVEDIEYINSTKGYITGTWETKEVCDASKEKEWTVTFRVLSYGLGTTPLTNNEYQKINVKVEGTTMNGTKEEKSTSFKLRQPTITNLTVSSVKDIDWKSSNLTTIGNTVNNMPLTKNENGQYIAHGYYLQFNFNSREWADAFFENIKITPEFYWLDNSGTYKKADIYYNIPNENKYNIPISKYQVGEGEEEGECTKITLKQDTLDQDTLKTFSNGEKKEGKISGTDVGNGIEYKKEYLFSYFLPSNLTVKVDGKEVNTGFLYVGFNITGYLEANYYDINNNYYEYRKLQISRNANTTNLVGVSVNDRGWTNGIRWNSTNDTDNTLNDGINSRFAFAYDLSHSAYDDLGLS